MEKFVSKKCERETIEMKKQKQFQFRFHLRQMRVQKVQAMEWLINVL